jgi:hypothetical protein
MFDITQFTPTETSFLHLIAPDTEEPIMLTIGVGDAETEVPVGITFHNPGSTAYEAASAKRTNRALVRGKRKVELTADLLRADTVSFLTDVTVSFENLDYPPAESVNGGKLFAALYSDRRYGWVVDQANAHLADWGNFTKKSAAS